MDVLSSYIMSPLKPSRCENPTVTIHEINPLCDDSLFLDICFADGILKDFCYQGNISLTAVGSLSFLHDVLCGMRVEDICDLRYDFFGEHDVEVTMKRQKTLALPLVSIINACREFCGRDDRLELEAFAYGVIGG